MRLSAAAAHFDRAAADLEGFARPLWGIAPLVAGGGDFDHWALYREGLSAGTDPDHPDYWGAITGIDQRQVELAAIGFALRIARPSLWDPLDDAAKKRVAAYLVAGREHEFVDSNWKFFRVMIDLGLMHCGVAVDPAKRNAYLDDLERFALGNGWYRDGRDQERRPLHPLRLPLLRADLRRLPRRHGAGRALSRAGRRSSPTPSATGTHPTDRRSPSAAA